MGTTIGKVMPVRRAWLEKKEARQYFGDCSNDYLEGLVKKELLTVAVIGKKVFYKMDSIERLFENSTIQVAKR